jgi:hypothetical protein
MDRRSFLRGTATTAVAAVPFSAFITQAEAKGQRPRTAGYGPLQPVADWTTGLPLLLLPKGFEYVSFGWTGDPLANGLPTPAAHDGIAYFRWRVLMFIVVI